MICIETQAYERRFPRCPQIPVVLDCEVTEDSVSEDGSQRTTKRKCKLNVEAPYILKKVRCPIVYFQIKHPTNHNKNNWKLF